MSTPTKLLSPRNVDILFDICRFRFTTTEQIRALHFAHLEPDSEAPRMLLYRLRKAGFLTKTQTYAQSKQTADGLTVTKPRPVWYLSRRCHRSLKRHLQYLGRITEYDCFESHQPPSESLSDQNLPHEIGLTYILMSFEEHVALNHDITDLWWLRTSPRHPLTSVKVATNATINPDALLFFRKRKADKTYPYFFYIEYERGRVTAKQYLRNKLEPYAEYFRASKRNVSTMRKPFAEVAAICNERYELKLAHPEKLLFRMLTVTSENKQADRLLQMVANVRNPEVFLFSNLTDCRANPFRPIWKQHISSGTQLTALP